MHASCRARNGHVSISGKSILSRACETASSFNPYVLFFNTSF